MKIETEKWLEIPGYRGYWASNLGKIKSLNKNTLVNKNIKERILKAFKHPFGYDYVSLYKNGKARKFSVHKLVLLAFIGETPKNKEVAHLDGNPNNNKLSNLAYVTSKENHLHMIAHGNSSAGTRNRHCKLTEDQVRKIKLIDYKNINLIESACVEFNISKDHLRAIIRGVFWKHL